MAVMFLRVSFEKFLLSSAYSLSRSLIFRKKRLFLADVDVRFLNQFQIDFEKTGIGLEISDPGTVLAFNNGFDRAVPAVAASEALLPRCRFC